MKLYRKKGLIAARPYVPGESLAGISVSAEDEPTKEGGMIASDPDNPRDQWYINSEYFTKYYEEAE